VVELYEATSDPMGFFEAVLGFEQMANRWFRLSRATQRRYFGKTSHPVPFGKKAIRIDQFGLVSVFKSCDFGKDFDIQRYRWSQASRIWEYATDGRAVGHNPGDF